MIICLVPARSGSKRIRNKNIQKVGKYPLIYWSLKTIFGSKIFDKIFVSTNSIKILKLSKKYGAEAPFIRPKNLSNDYATDKDVINHFLGYLKKKNIKISILCYFYPTSILITKKILIASYNKFLKNRNKSLIAATRYSAPIEIAMLKKGRLLNFINSKHSKKRTQDMKKAYHDAGQFYWHNIKNYKIIKSKKFNFYYLDRSSTVDLDTKEDLDLLKILFKSKIGL